ncbi:MAG: hypothetical protein KBA31_18540 [Alphaproteobacteria bacterium]|nr:hypothetical protein [Alphaproteobacteria bacterium]
MPAAEAALAAATSRLEREAAVLSFADAIRAKLKGTSLGAETPPDRVRLARARDVIRPFAAEPPLSLPLAEATLEIALRLDDGPLALLAWRSYAREGAEVGRWKSAARRLEAALPGIPGRAPTERHRDEVFSGLTESQFFEFAALVASDDRVPDAAAFRARSEVANVIAYATALDRFRDLTDAYYRDHAMRRGNPKAWQEALFGAGETLWRSLSFSGPTPPFAADKLGIELNARFGAIVNLGQTSGVLDLHYGHVFIDDNRRIEQYGRSASIRVVALDRVVSNGYESWAWDGRQGHGGWAEVDRVIQVRPRYVDGALREWERTTNPKNRAEEEARVARLAQGDDAIARDDAAAYLPGLAARLDWQGLNAIVARLRAQGVGAPDLKRRFIIDYNRIGLEANFFAHEGRHVLDRQQHGGGLSVEEREFRAKLSEIAFSEQPRFSFGPIMSANIADPASPHGRANKRIMQGLVAWMEAHRSSVTGLDPARPLLPQFDKLSDDQMRAAMRAMDPWAR